MAFDRAFDDGRDQIANVAVGASTVSTNITEDLIFMFRVKRPLYFRLFRLDETAETDVSDQRGRRKQHSFTQAASNELKLGEGGYLVVRAGHRLGGGVGE